MDRHRLADRIRPLLPSNENSDGLRGISAGLALFVVIAMTTSNVAGAAHPLTTLKAPFKNTSLTYPRSASTAGCSTARVSAPATWSPTTGIGKFSAKNTAATCKGYFGTAHTTSSSDSLTSFVVALPVHPGYFTTSIQTTWVTKAIATQNITHSGKCSPVSNYDSAGNASSECYADVSIELYSIVYLIDTTTGAVYYGNPIFPLDMSNFSEYFADNGCVYYVCTPYSYTVGGSPGGFSVSMTNTSYINGSFTPADHYELFSEVAGYIVTEVGFQSYPTVQPGGSFKANVVASINLSSGGCQTTLKSIVLA
jgi:hypothetical protein